MGVPGQAGYKEQMSLFSSSEASLSLSPSDEGAAPFAEAGTVVGVLLSCLLNRGVTSQSHPRVGIPGAWPRWSCGIREALCCRPLGRGHGWSRGVQAGRALESLMAHRGSGSGAVLRV